MKCVTKIIVVLVLLTGFAYWFYKHSGFFLYEHNSMQYMPNMHHTKVLIPQRGYDFFANGAGARVPPKGSLAQNQNPYAYTKETLAANVPRAGNPLPATHDVVIRGQKVFNNVCIVCHGASGQGDGSVVPPFQKPPSLTSDKIRGYADSQIFHVITVGQNNMGAYAPVVRESDRWAVIHYIRALQRAANPTEEDLRTFENISKAGVKSK